MNMSEREIFIAEIEEKINNGLELSEAAIKYFEKMKEAPAKRDITENGEKILKYAQENAESFNNVFTSKSIGENIQMSSRTVSGAMRKLVTDGFFDKEGNNPVMYKITDKGLSYTF